MKLLMVDKKIIDVHPQRKSWGFTLNELKALVEGDVEIILLSSGDYLLFCAKIEGRTLNKFASQLANDIGHMDHPIFGPALLAKHEEIEP